MYMGLMDKLDEVKNKTTLDDRAMQELRKRKNKNQDEQTDQD